LPLHSVAEVSRKVTAELSVVNTTQYLVLAASVPQPASGSVLTPFGVTAADADWHSSALLGSAAFVYSPHLIFPVPAPTSMLQELTA